MPEASGREPLPPPGTESGIQRSEIPSRQPLLLQLPSLSAKSRLARGGGGEGADSGPAAGDRGRRSGEETKRPWPQSLLEMEVARELARWGGAGGGVSKNLLLAPSVVWAGEAPHTRCESSETQEVPPLSHVGLSS